MRQDDTDKAPTTSVELESDLHRCHVPTPAAFSALILLRPLYIQLRSALKPTCERLAHRIVVNKDEKKVFAAVRLVAWSSPTHTHTLIDVVVCGWGSPALSRLNVIHRFVERCACQSRGGSEAHRGGEATATCSGEKRGTRKCASI